MTKPTKQHNETEIPEKRKHCFELMRHPLNRAYFERMLIMLKDGGVYGWIDMQEVFTKAEIQAALTRQDG